MVIIDWFEKNKDSNDVVKDEGFVIINYKDEILDTLVGPVATIFSRSKDFCDGYFVMILSRMLDDRVKVSMRVANGKDVNLKKLMGEIIQRVGSGQYGGHNHAVGAIIKKDQEENFIGIARQVLKNSSLEEKID